MKDIVIAGAGGLGREVAWLLEGINYDRKQWNILGYVDDNPAIKGKIYEGYEVLGGWDCLLKYSGIFFTVAIGDPAAKKDMLGKMNKTDASMATLIHPNASTGKTSRINPGAIIQAGCRITVNVSVGTGVILNLNCTVGHDAVIGDFSTLHPAVNISGRVNIGEACLLGTNCSVIQNVTIADNVTVGAGAVVTRDLPFGCTAVGVPAKAR